MRKTAALLVAAAILASLTSCGKIVSRVNVSSGDSVSQAQESSGMSADSEQKEKSSKKKKDKHKNTEIQAVEETYSAPEIVYVEDSAMAEPIRQTIGVADESESLVGRLFPDELAAAMDGADAEEYMLMAAGVSEDSGWLADMQDVLIRSEREASADEISEAEHVFSAYTAAFRLLNDNGVTLEMVQKRGDSEMMNGIAAQLDRLLSADGIRSSEVIVHIAEMKYVTTEIGGNVSEVPMYRPDGEDWKMGAFLLNF